MHRKRAIDRYVTVGVSAGAERRLRKHLEHCDECRSYYDQQLHLRRALAGQVGEPSADEHARMVRRALEGAGLEAPTTLDERASLVERVLAFPGPSLGFAAAAMAIVVVGVAVSGEPAEGAASSGSLGVLQTRSATEAPPVGLRVRCVDNASAKILAKAEAGPRSPLGALRCGSSQQLSFAPTNLSKDAVYVFVVGMERGAPQWMPPFGASASAVRVEAGVIDEPLKALASLQAHPSGGRITLYALFADQPFDGRAIESALQRRGGLVATAALDRLPVDMSWQARIELTIESEAHP